MFSRLCFPLFSQQLLESAEDGIFNRSQKYWLKIDKGVFTVGNDKLFNSDYCIKLRQEMLEYYREAIKIKKPRDDYLELLNLCFNFFGSGGSTETSQLGVEFRAPGATYNARWMAKATYCLKMYIIQH